MISKTDQFSLTPMAVSDEELRQWSERRPLALRAAQFWASHAPRAKGAVPRWIGRNIGGAWRAVVQIPGGPKLAVYPPALDIFTSIVHHGGWDPHIARTCISQLQPGQVFYDLGANAGYVALMVALHHRDVKVMAFEPQPGLARCAAVSARLNGLTNVGVFPTLLGEEDGQAELWISAHAIHSSMIFRRKGARSVAYPIHRLDSLIDSGIIPAPDFIKIDVEGAEEQVFAGGEAHLRRRPPKILFEAYSGRQEKLKMQLRQYARFEFFAVTEAELRPVSAEGEDAWYTDFLAVPSGS